jgi:hypothetical protein
VDDVGDIGGVSCCVAAGPAWRLSSSPLTRPHDFSCIAVAEMAERGRRGGGTGEDASAGDDHTEAAHPLWGIALTLTLCGIARCVWAP